MTKKKKGFVTKRQFVYICGTDWDWEIGREDDSPSYNDVYNTVGALKRYKPCWPTCGILKVRLVDVGWVEKPRNQVGQNIPSKKYGRPKVKLVGHPIHKEDPKHQLSMSPILMKKESLKIGDKISVLYERKAKTRAERETMGKNPIHEWGTAIVARRGNKLAAKIKSTVVGTLVFAKDIRKCWALVSIKEAQKRHAQ